MFLVMLAPSDRPLHSLPPSTPHADISRRVEDTLQSMGLSEVADHRIGTPIQRGISGGQKRRVTIASAVVSQPQILLCDEPTSGLDSTTSYKVISSSSPIFITLIYLVLTTRP